MGLMLKDMNGLSFLLLIQGSPSSLGAFHIRQPEVRHCSLIPNIELTFNIMNLSKTGFYYKNNKETAYQIETQYLSAVFKNPQHC